MSMDTFYGHRGFRYLWFNAVILILLCVIYRLNQPVGGPSGGTVLGYAYGGLATAGILYLMWFGIRKRAYYSKRSTLKGALSAHIWLGLALALIVPMHAGFSFGINVHTLAYVIMVLVIVSGMWGAFAYVDLAPHIQSHRGGGSTRNHLEQIQLMSADILDMGHSKSDEFVRLLNKIDFPFHPTIWSSLFGKRRPQLEGREVGELLSTLPAGERDEAAKLISLVNKKRDLACRVQDETALMAKLKLWLYVHLPLSIALLAVVAIHIFVVFYYW